MGYVIVIKGEAIIFYCCYAADRLGVSCRES